MSNDNDAAGVFLVVMILALVALVFTGIACYNRSEERDEARQQVEAKVKIIMDQAQDMNEATKRAHQLTQSAEALDPAMIAQLEKLIDGNVSEMSVAEALRIRALIDSRITTLTALGVKYKSALESIGVRPITNPVPSK